MAAARIELWPFRRPSPWLESMLVRPLLMAAGKQVGGVGMTVEADFDRATGCVKLQPGKPTSMLTHRMKIVIPESHEVILRLPSHLPSGDAEVIVLADATASPTLTNNIEAWLNALIAGGPDSPVIPLEALRRENMYE